MGRGLLLLDLMASSRMSGVKTRPLTAATFIPGAMPALKAGPPKIASVTTPSLLRLSPMEKVVMEIPREMRPARGGSGEKANFQPLAVMPPTGASVEVEFSRAFQKPAQSYFT